MEASSRHHLAMTDFATAARSAPAALRNRDPILNMLREVLPSQGLVLEIASGTGEHIVHFARNLPTLEWQPSDPDGFSRASITVWSAHEKLSNIRPPLDLDVQNLPWPVTKAAAILCSNMVHISPWSATEALIQGAGTLLSAGAPLILYGPFRQLDSPFAPSNAAFDNDLRQRNPQWGIRLLDDVTKLAKESGFGLDRIEPMPANNLSVVFRRG